MKKLLSILLSFAVFLSLILLSCSMVSASDGNVISGKITDNSTYSFDKNSGELTIDGYGMIWTGRVLSEDLYSQSVKTEDIKKLIIKGGITIFDLDIVFSSYDENIRISEITLPKSIKKISGSFKTCELLKTIHYGGTKDDWNKVIGSDDKVFSKMNIQYSVPVEKSATGLSGKENEVKTEKLSENISCTYNYITEELVINGRGELKTNEENWQLSRLLFTAGDPYSDYYTRFVNFKDVVINDGITKLCNGNFQYDNLESITIPESVKIIEENCFGTLSADEDASVEVYYAGSSDDWNKIEIGKYNEMLTKGKLHFADSSADKADTFESTSAISTDNEQIEKSNNTIYIIAGASAAIVLIAAAVLIVIRKKKSKQ
ncbi:MAG: leucine-rich repeat domain-containing protein [Eubacterium sp.]|nr:leucine-rich repeat domain-containing protein [Eubacterium sp.]